MADHRPFAASARRRALARASGLTAASPIVVGALAWIGAVVAMLVFGRAIAAGLATWVARACSASHPEPVPSMSAITGDVLAFILPIAIAAAVGAVVAHLAQTRGLWLPRRQLRGAPALDTSRTQHASLGLLGALAIGGLTLAWLWAVAPRLGRLVETPTAGVRMLIAFVATLGTAWIVLGTLDGLLRRAEFERSLRMTAAEKREDERMAGADPRWRAERARFTRGPSVRDAVAGASVVLLGDGVAVAVAWDPVRRPVPVRTASGRDARATQILGLARRHGIAVHRDPELALALVDGEGPVPEATWARLAEIIAATARRAG